MRHNNKGVSLITVIITISLVTMMVTFVLYAALICFDMKKLDVRTKDNFYSAEKVVDEIKAGLVSQESAAIEEAYVYVMQNYDSIGSDTREAVFQQTYQDAMIESVAATPEHSTYDLDKLQTYLVDTAAVYKDGVRKSGALLSSNSGTELYVQTGKIILKNLVVDYLASDGSQSIVETDIVLNVPEYHFLDTALYAAFMDYTLIAGDGMQAQGGVDCDISGSIYAGENGLDVKTGAKISLQDKGMVVTPSDITVADSAQMNTGIDTAIWADNIKIDNATMKLQGTDYIANDLTLGKNAKLTMDGQYYGYGNPKSAKLSAAVADTDVENSEADYSSAILVNGKDVSLDMSGIDRLLLAGNAYIGTKNLSKENTQNVCLGQSLGVKTDQIMYLIPASVVGRSAAGEMLESGGANPMTQENYEKLRQEVNYDLLTTYTSKENVYANLGVSSMEAAVDKALVDYYAVSTEQNKSLDAMGAHHYIKAFYLSGATSMVYLYMQFDDEESANQYYRDYYEANRDRLKQYNDMYFANLEVTDSFEQLNLNGNMIDSVDGGYEILRDTVALEDGDTKQYIASIEEEYQNMFAALSRTLTSDYQALTDTEKNNSLFGNLIEESRITQDELTLTAPNLTSQFVVVKNEGKAAYVVDDSSIQSGIVIATGDVLVNSNFEGMIIAKGQITIRSAAKITKNTAVVASALSAQNADGSIRAMNFVKTNGKYQAPAAEAEDENAEINLADLITFENWEKR